MWWRNVIVTLAIWSALVSVASLLVGTDTLQAQPAAPLPAVPDSYADVADHAVSAASIIDAEVRKVREVEAARAVGVPPHLIRLYVEARVNTVIYGRNPVAARIAYITDQPRQPNGRAPRLKGQRVLLFARPVTTANQVQLVVPRAQLGWTAQRDGYARAIAAELASGTVPPEITGVTQAFHVPGTVPGESETQMFLRTGNDQPVSLTVLRRPGQAPRWAVAFGEILDESASVPAPYTLGWYRLTCGLPATLPNASVAGLSADALRATMADYAFVRQRVGLCDRTQVPPG